MAGFWEIFWTQPAISWVPQVLEQNRTSDFVKYLYIFYKMPPKQAKTASHFKIIVLELDRDVFQAMQHCYI